MTPEAKYFPLDEAQPGAIRPEEVATKIADVRRLKYTGLAKYFRDHPRAIEAFWFLQWISMQPGGLAEFVTRLLGFIGPRLGTESARRFGQRKYTRAECLKIWSEMPPSAREGMDEDGYDDHMFSLSMKDVDDPEREAAAIRRRAKGREDEIFEGNEPFLRKIAQECASDQLAHFFHKLVTGDSEHTARWYCPDVLAEVIAYMDHRANQVKTRLAQTVVAVKVFDALDYAYSERVMVNIAGDPRFGKTEAVETWAAMWPGRGRVVRTPPSNSVRDLIRAVAEAFGIHQTFGTHRETLKDKVEFVIRFSGCAVIFDEGSYLVPSNFSADTAPARLNWVRSAIIDRKVPCAIVVTPQSYNGAVNRFVKRTQYSIEQFIGREAMRVALPNELSQEDLLAVARVHFPEADEDLLAVIAGTAMQTESYLKAVENIARRARYNAHKRGAKKLSIRDVDTAIEEVMPQAAPAPRAEIAPAAPRVQRRRSAAAKVLRTQFREGAEQFPARSTTPVDASQEADPVLATG